MPKPVFLPLALGEAPDKLPVRVQPRIVTLHIEPEQMGRMMQRCGVKFYEMLGIAMGSGATTHKACDIFNVGDDELLIRNYPDEVVPRPLTACVKLLSNGNLYYSNVQDQ